MLGVLLAVFGYESQQFQRTSTLGVQPSEDRLAYFSFYENLYHTSVTVIEDVYGDADHAHWNSRRISAYSLDPSPEKKARGFSCACDSRGIYAFRHNCAASLRLLPSGDRTLCPREEAELAMDGPRSETSAVCLSRQVKVEGADQFPVRISDDKHSSSSM